MRYTVNWQAYIKWQLSDVCANIGLFFEDFICGIIFNNAETIV